MDKVVPIFVTALLAIVGFVGVKFWEGSNQVAQIKPTMNSVERSVDKLETKLDSIRVQIRELDHRMVRIEVKLDRHEDDNSNSP